VSYFREQYLPLSRSEKNRLTSAFLDHVFSLSYDPKLRLLFGTSTPGLDWEEVERGQMVILDFKNVSDPETRRFAMLWIFQNLYEHIKRRGRWNYPLAVCIDEFADLAQQVTDGVNPLAVLFSEFIQRYMRNNQIFLYRVKHFRKVWGKEDPPPFFARLPERHMAAKLQNPNHHYYVLDHEPQHMPLPEQLELGAQLLTGLGLFRFLCRPALREGEVSQSVIPISIDSVIRDTETNEYLFPDQALVDRVRSRLAAQSGIPVAAILKEQEARLTDGTIQELRQAPLHARTNPTLPTLDEHENEFLAFIISNPGTPVAAVYKELAVGGAQGTRLRESLKAQGLAEELEVRTASARGGRPTKCVIPTVAVLERLGKDAPSGRGGVLHRHIQHMVVHGARAKGYSATVEHKLETGAIVDVQLEKGAALRIAVEIAIVSTPEREIAHIRNCVASGYDQVYVIFADERLLARTATDMQREFSKEEQGAVRLLPLRQLGHVGQGTWVFLVYSRCYFPVNQCRINSRRDRKNQNKPKSDTEITETITGAPGNDRWRNNLFWFFLEYLLLPGRNFRSDTWG
jgi:hypothetical protein